MSGGFALCIWPGTPKFVLFRTGLHTGWTIGIFALVPKARLEHVNLWLDQLETFRNFARFCSARVVAVSPNPRALRNLASGFWHELA
jgi:hypothetical protein